MNKITDLFRSSPKNQDVLNVELRKANCSNILVDTFEFEVVEISIEEGDCVSAGEKVMKLKSPIKIINEVIMPQDGIILNVTVEKGQKIRIGDKLFKLQKAESVVDFNSLVIEYRKKKLHNTTVALLTDDFTKKKSLSFTKIAGEEISYLKMFSDSNKVDYFVGITFEYSNGLMFIKFISLCPSFTLAKGDSIILLFENDTTLSLTFQMKPVGEKSIHINIYPLTIEELNKFAVSNLKKIKVTSRLKGIFDVYHFNKEVLEPQYRSEVEAQYILRFMVACFVKAQIENNLMLPSS